MNIFLIIILKLISSRIILIELKLDFSLHIVSLKYLFTKHVRQATGLYLQIPNKTREDVEIPMI